MSSPPDYSEQDKAALLALTTRYSAIQDENKALQAAKAEIDAKLVAGREKLLKLCGAFAVFGFDVSKPGSGGFQRVRNTVGSRAYLAALHAAGRPYGETATRDEDAGSPVTEDDSLHIQSDDEAAENGSVRELTLEQLKQAGVQGITAAAIRNHIETVRSTQLHYKTVGMTLYRLTQDGLARREGRTWFAVDKTTNPGVGAPGSN